MKVLGIDPGLRYTGFGVVEASKKRVSYITSGVITTDAKMTLPNRLKTILTGLTEIIIDTKPDFACIEKVFVNVNPQSTILLGQARGAAITTCVLHNIDVGEFTALQIKKSVVGYGHADKHQVSKMVQYLLKLNGEPSPDAADALAIALTYVYNTPDRLLV